MRPADHAHVTPHIGGGHRPRGLRRNTILAMAAMIAVLSCGPASAQRHRHATTSRGTTPHAPSVTTARQIPDTHVEALHVTSINLSEEGATILDLRTADGAKIGQVSIPLTTCRRDHLGRLLPGNDVDLPVQTIKAGDGTVTRYVDPEAFRTWCE